MFLHSNPEYKDTPMDIAQLPNLPEKASESSESSESESESKENSGRTGREQVERVRLWGRLRHAPSGSVPVRPAHYTPTSKLSLWSLAVRLAPCPHEGAWPCREDERHEMVDSGFSRSFKQKRCQIPHKREWFTHRSRIQLLAEELPDSAHHRAAASCRWTGRILARRRQSCDTRVSDL